MERRYRVRLDELRDDRERQGIQKFVGQADWDHRPLLTELTRQVGVELGRPNGVLVFDHSAFL